MRREVVSQFTSTNTDRSLTKQTAHECGIYALAMAMATEPEVTRPLDWSAGTLEKRYYDALRDLRYDYSGPESDRVLIDSDLSDIIYHWGRRYKDTYALYIDIGDHIQLLDTDNLDDPNCNATKDSKVILVRRGEDVWQACCHFEKEKSSVNTPLASSSTDQHSTSQSSVDSIYDQKGDCNTSVISGKHNNSAGEASDVSTPVDLGSEKLVNTLERLISGVENLSYDLKEHTASNKSLQNAVTELIAQSARPAGTTEAEAGSDLDGVTNHPGSRTSTEYDLGLNTPSTVQDVGALQSASELEDSYNAFGFYHIYEAAHYPSELDILMDRMQSLVDKSLDRY
jgi:hypothetical protein